MKPSTYYLSFLKGYGKVKDTETPPEAMPLDATDDGFRLVLAEKQANKKVQQQQDYWTSVKKKILQGEIVSPKPSTMNWAYVPTTGGAGTPQEQSQWFAYTQPMPELTVSAYPPFPPSYKVIEFPDEVVPDDPTPF